MPARARAISSSSGRREPVLRRGACRRALRQRRARRDRRGLGRRSASRRPRPCRHGARRARREDRPAADRREGRAAGRRVSGPVFSRAGVVHLLEGVGRTRALEERDLVVSVRSLGDERDRELAIKHALTREVAYGSIPKARRGRLHADLADWLEDAPTSAGAARVPLRGGGEGGGRGSRVGGRAGQLRVSRTRRALALAGWASSRRGRHEMEEAIELFSRAVGLSDDEHEQALLWRAIGEAQALRYDGEGMRPRCSARSTVRSTTPSGPTRMRSSPSSRRSDRRCGRSD